MSDLEMLENESLPIEERVEIAKRIAQRYELGEASVREMALFSEFMTMNMDKLGDVVKEKRWVMPIEEAIARGVYEYRIEKLKDEISKMSINEIAERYLEAKSKIERKLFAEALKERKDEIEEMSVVAQVMQITQAIENIPKIDNPVEFKYLSDAQIKRVKKPTRSYAKDAFMNGLWNLEWGDPEDYGIDSERAINYVSRPNNKDFAAMALRKGLWRDEWEMP